MADIDKALPNVETEIKIPGEEEIVCSSTRNILMSKLVQMILK
jgi:hypothetical protein